MFLHAERTADIPGYVLCVWREAMCVCMGVDVEGAILYVNIVWFAFFPAEEVRKTIIIYHPSYIPLVDYVQEHTI